MAHRKIANSEKPSARDNHSNQAEPPVPMIPGWHELRPEYRQIYLELVSLTDEFCKEFLNEEYQELCRSVAMALCQPGSPVKQGKRASWACGIVASVGWVNFLTDPSNDPHMRSEEIAKRFCVSVGTMHAKAKVIREGLQLIPFDPDFCLPSRLKDNPLVWILEVNGFLMDIRDAPKNAQVVAYEEGLIPFIPADAEEIQPQEKPRRPK